MQPSFYLKAFDCDDAEGQVLLFSLKKASIIRVPKELFCSLQNGNLPQDKENQLFKLGMAVENQEAEKREMLSFFDRLNRKNTQLHITAVLNLDCNFDCIYCYEGSDKGRLYMAHQTADRLMDFIRDNFTKEKNSLRLDFYGGEPLLSMDLIRYISSAATDFTGSMDADCRLTLVTNGSLLKPRIAKELAHLGVNRARITIDGPAYTHNQSRPFKNGAGSFDTIINNIRQACDLIKIGIGGNFEKHNYRQFPALLDYLLDTDLTPDKIGPVKFDPVMKAPEDDTSIPEYYGGCASLNESWIREAEEFLREEILKRGYATQKVRPVTCMVDVSDSWVVHYDGTLYKCPAFIGKSGFEAGDLKSGILDYNATYQTEHWRNERCAECEYLPLCFGGCRYIAYVREGGIGTLDCRKDYLDARLEGLVKQDARHAQKA
ncbi:MAG: geopeptide radical SAM maturase [Desulfobacteraceae bacterium]|nr:geopeptide radical SAM maturase [Desulfobacteraceae bacterium]